MKKALGMFLVAAVLAAGLFLGGAPLDWGAALAALGARRWDDPSLGILLQLRLPRLALAGTVGALLAAAGTALQATLRNPLADPYLLGVSGGAALGAVAGAACGVLFPVPWAVAGAGCALALVLGLSHKAGRLDPTRLVLTGAVFHSVASSAMTLFLLKMSGRPDGAGLYFWLLGGLTALPWGQLAMLITLAALASAGLYFLAPALNLLVLGRDEAQSLGLPADRFLWVAMATAAAATGLAVTFNGMIPFIGLLAPHAARGLVGRDHRKALPAAALLGGATAVLADALGRWAAAPREIPTGVIASLAGAPFFLWLLRRRL